jgi:hypothetical protein
VCKYVVIFHIESCLEFCVLFGVMYIIVLYCILLYFTFLHCSTLPLGINPFAATTITTTAISSNNNIFGTVKSPLELLRDVSFYFKSKRAPLTLIGLLVLLYCIVFYFTLLSYIVAHCHLV